MGNKKGFTVVELLITMAIITHELISNACRHAYPEDRRGTIAVACSRAVGGVSLVVRDSGVGQGKGRGAGW